MPDDAKKVLAEAWASILRILTELFVTIVILLSLQFVHIVVGALTLQEPVKYIISFIHSGGTILVLGVLTLAYVNRMAKHALGIGFNWKGRSGNAEEPSKREGRS